jgi:ATP-dependent DNA helicase RecG
VNAPVRSLSDPVRFVKGVGPAREALLARLGISSAGDLLFLFPARYEDRRNLAPLSSLRGGETVSVTARVAAFERRKTARKGLSVITALISDGRTMARAVWFNRVGLEKVLLPGVRVLFYGRVDVRGGAVQLTNPDFEILDEDGDEEQSLAIVPVYPTTAGLSQKALRRMTRSVLDDFLPDLDEYLPEDLRSRLGLPGVAGSVRELHFPRSRETWKAARRRLAFDEFFLLQTGLAVRRSLAGETASPAPSLPPGKLVAECLENRLPFSLTDGQKRAVEDIFADMERTVPMNRLLQGDVGSGKTVVALLALLAAMDGGCQGAFLAPTEILARQHYLRLAPMIEALGGKCALLTGSLPAREKAEIQEGLESGEISVAIGTHALLSEKTAFARMGIAIVDEQHRFGVLQKHTFRSKGGSPHVLVMTATPIPRTLTLTVYGDLSVSVISELPPGRKPVATRAIPPKKIPGLLSFLEERMEAGERVYWICPLIEESETLDLAAAEARFAELGERFSPFGAGLLHGRLPNGEKENVMDGFQRGDISLLVSTTVVEVGVDVPEATIMVVEDAVRFGLSQLHQLRGRVGRGTGESWCFLICAPSSPEARERIEAFCATSDGFAIAEADLRLRGPGEVCGVRQSGVTDFRVADLIRDRDILETARKEAFGLVAKDPGLLLCPKLKDRLYTVLGRSLNLVETA